MGQHLRQHAKFRRCVVSKRNWVGQKSSNSVESVSAQLHRCYPNNTDDNRFMESISSTSLSFLESKVFFLVKSIMKGTHISHHVNTF